MKWNGIALGIVCLAMAAAASAGPLVADATGDGKVNVLDLLAVRNALGESPAQYPRADVNGDGKINVLDLLAVRNGLGDDNVSLTDYPSATATVDDAVGLAPAPLPVSLAADYFPLAVGNYWEYEVRWQGTIREKYRVEVTGKAYSYHYFTFYRVSRYFPHALPESRLVCRTYGNNVYEWPAAGRSLNLWYMLGAAPGSTWRFTLDGGEPCYSPLSAALENRSEKVSVPAGEFANCVKIVYGHGCADAGLEAEWFAPGAGLVKRVETTFAGPVETVLTKACVDGEIIPGLRLLDGFGALAKSDAPSYTANMMPPGIVIPTMEAALVAFNYGLEAITFGFSSSQRFDFVIRDAKGFEWYRWSDGRAFLTVMGSETLLNDRLVYSVKIYLENRMWVGPQAMPLPEGLYTLEAFLTSYDRPMSAKTTFEMKWVR